MCTLYIYISVCVSLRTTGNSNDPRRVSRTIAFLPSVVTCAPAVRCSIAPVLAYIHAVEALSRSEISQTISGERSRYFPVSLVSCKLSTPRCASPPARRRTSHHGKSGIICLLLRINDKFKVPIGLLY